MLRRGAMGAGQCPAVRVRATLVKRPWPGYPGFTLVEVVVVLAVLGIIAGIAVPLLPAYLSQADERAYAGDQRRIQGAVNAFFVDPNNKYLDRRQFPIHGIDKTGPSLILVTPGTFDTETILSPRNPLGGAVGGTPIWVDDGDGLRSPGEEALNDALDPATDPGWHTAATTFEGTVYYVDSRDFFIDFNRLVSEGLLPGVPDSASADNESGETGALSWYVDAGGLVRSLDYTFPVSK